MSEDVEAECLLLLYEAAPTSFNLELRIKLETMKQLKRIADQLKRWNTNGMLDVIIHKEE